MKEQLSPQQRITRLRHHLFDAKRAAALRASYEITKSIKLSLNKTSYFTEVTLEETHASYD